MFGLGWFLTPVARVGIFYFTDQPTELPTSLTDSNVDDASHVNETKHAGLINLSSDLNESIRLIRDALTWNENYAGRCEALDG